MPNHSAEIPSNPLLFNQPIPAFDKIEAQHVIPAVRQVLADAERHLGELEKNIIPTWDGLVEELANIGEPVRRVWSPVSHLNGVLNTPDLRKAYESVQGDIVSFGLRMSQSEPIYQGLKAIQTSQIWDSLSEAQQRIISQKILWAELSGIGLVGEARKRFLEIEQELTKLKTQFSNNVLDATKAGTFVLRTRADVEGMSESLLRLASQTFNANLATNAAPGTENSSDDAEKSKSTPEDGPWMFTLDATSFLPFMQQSKRRDLREKLYRAYVTRASSGQWDNTRLVPAILKLRQEKAKLLGYRNYAELSLASKMAPDLGTVYNLLEELRSASFDHAKGEIQDIRNLAAERGQTDPLMNWDVAYWKKRMEEERYELDEEKLKQFFPLPRVLEGLFALVKKIFQIEVRPAQGEVPTWHQDVMFFKIYNERSEHIASFFLDPYSRPENKRGGAWMDECVVRRKHHDKIEIPVAYLVCNFTPPIENKPSLLTFREVETLFHEFGHGLQHMLTTVDFVDASGINGVEWDAVELPSQFMENWCYHRPTLLGLAAHVDTGAPLPEDLYNKIQTTRTFFSGHDCLRQLQFATTDLKIHETLGNEQLVADDVFNVEREVSKTCTIIPPLASDRALCSFLHIFAGGYDAGYYSYKWAEVLSADAFSAFEEINLNDEKQVAALGHRFRDTVLALGGGRHPSKVFADFRGRGPKTEALLRHSGLAAASRS